MVKVDMLKNLSYFKNFGENTVIIQEGEERGDQMYIILEGRAGVYRNYGTPDQVTLTELNPGDFFGEMTLFLDRPRTATVVALSPMKALEITQENAHEFFESDPEATYLLIQALCSRLENINSSYSQLYSSVPHEPAKSAADAKPKPADNMVSSLFPEGHASYTLPELPVKAGLLRNETLTCPICQNKFDFPHVRTVHLRTLSMDYDMRRRYDGIDVTHYLAAACPKCFFSAIAEKFSNASKNNVAQLLKVTEPYRRELKLSPDDTSANTIFARLYLAIACAPLCYDDHIMLTARLWINVSWLYRDCGDEKMERYAMQQALAAYLKAYTTIKLDKKTEQAICMIAGELSYKLGNESEGKKLLFTAKTNRDGAAMLSNLAEDRLLEIKELEAKRQ